jgi:hypothetical protein
MNKQELTDRLARESHRSRSQAADAVDNLVYQLLKDLRTGQPSTLPANSNAPVDPTVSNPPAKGDQGQGGKK